MTTFVRKHTKTILYALLGAALVAEVGWDFMYAKHGVADELDPIEISASRRMPSFIGIFEVIEH